MSNNNLNHMRETVQQIFGSKVKDYPAWWIENYYNDFKFYNCSPEKYRQLIKSRG